MIVSFFGCGKNDVGSSNVGKSPRVLKKEAKDKFKAAKLNFERLNEKISLEDFSLAASDGEEALFHLKNKAAFSKVRDKLIRNFLIQSLKTSSYEKSEIFYHDFQTVLIDIEETEKLHVFKTYVKENENESSLVRFKIKLNERFSEHVHFEFGHWDHYTDSETIYKSDLIPQNGEHEIELRFEVSNRLLMHKIRQRLPFYVRIYEADRKKLDQKVLSMENQILDPENTDYEDLKIEKTLPKKISEDLVKTYMDHEAIVKVHAFSENIEHELVVSPRELIEKFPFFHSKIKEIVLNNKGIKVQGEAFHGLRLSLESYYSRYLFKFYKKEGLAPDVTRGCDIYFRKLIGKEINFLRPVERFENFQFLISGENHSNDQQTNEIVFKGLKKQLQLYVKADREGAAFIHEGFHEVRNCSDGQDHVAVMRYFRRKIENEEFPLTKDEHPVHYLAQVELFFLPWEQILWQ